MVSITIKDKAILKTDYTEIITVLLEEPHVGHCNIRGWGGGIRTPEW